jgi:hypothetical protein
MPGAVSEIRGVDAAGGKSRLKVIKGAAKSNKTENTMVYHTREEALHGETQRSTEFHRERLFSVELSYFSSVELCEIQQGRN